MIEGKSAPETVAPGLPSAEIHRKYVANAHEAGMGNRSLSSYLPSSGRTDVVVTVRSRARSF
jgi:hypothetical protein